MYRSPYQEILYLAVLLHSGSENLTIATAHPAFPIPNKLPPLPMASTDIKGEECLLFLLIYFLSVLHSIIYIFLTLLNLFWGGNIIQIDFFSYIEYFISKSYSRENTPLGKKATEIRLGDYLPGYSSGKAAVR